MKTHLVLISLSLFCSLNAAPLKRTKGPKTTTTDAGFVAKYFHIPEFLKFSQNDDPSEPTVKTLELPQKSRFGKILDSINIFKKAKPFGEPYLRAYLQSDGSYKWYFVYPGQMLYPAPDQFSFDTINQALQKTTPTTTTTTTTTTTPPPVDIDDTPKPLYPLMGKIEFVKNETEPKENKWAITISDSSGPIFQPYGKIQPPFDEPLFHSIQGDDHEEQEPQVNPVDEQSESVTRRRHKKHTRTPPPTEESSAPPEESIEEEQPEPEDEPEQQDETREDNPAAYDNAEAEPEPEENAQSADENTPDGEEGQGQDEEQTAEDDESPDDEDTPTEPPVKKATSLKPSVT